MKRTLAITSGVSAFASPLHVGRPNLGAREAFLRRVNEMFDRRWLSNDGPLVREFELRVAGDQTLGVWGGLNADDRRALHKVWTSRRRDDIAQLPEDEAGEAR